MVYPLDENLDPTFEDLYEKLYLFDEDDPDGEGYFIKYTRKCFPSILSTNEQFEVIVKVLAWAVARSYQQPIILRYIYDPDLVMGVLLPRLADTLDFKIPIDYPEEEVRMLIKYLQKIRRTRGTFASIKKLIRILNITRREILEMNWRSYESVDVVESEDTGVLFVQYNNIYDLDFVMHMLKYVMPAGYLYRVETGLDTWGITGNVYRNRLEFTKYNEHLRVDQQNFGYDSCTVEYRLSIAKNDIIRGDTSDVHAG